MFNPEEGSGIVVVGEEVPSVEPERWSCWQIPAPWKGVVLSHVLGLTGPGWLWSVQLLLELEGLRPALGKGQWMWTEGTQRSGSPSEARLRPQWVLTAPGVGWGQMTWAVWGAEAEPPNRSRPSWARESGAKGKERKESLQCGCRFSSGGESARQPTHV